MASRTDEYRYLHDLGAGDIAANAHDWYRMVKRLLTDESYRTERALAGVEAATGLTYEEHATDWWDAWTSARENFEKGISHDVA